MTTQAARQEAPSTKKGRATRERIIAAAADLMYRHGAAGTSTPALRDAAGVSSSQIYHYFADKDDLIRAVIVFQTEAILANQAPLLARLDSLDALRAWRDVLVDAARQQHGAGGCPLGSLSSELSSACSPMAPCARKPTPTGIPSRFWPPSRADFCSPRHSNPLTPWKPPSTP
jgi:TetR/AcrR family transcriptional regulator, transcriptional repressor for nem operon